LLAQHDIDRTCDPPLYSAEPERRISIFSISSGDRLSMLKPGATGSPFSRIWVYPLPSPRSLISVPLTVMPGRRRKASLTFRSPNCSNS
jgi:hypothetical protein